MIRSAAITFVGVWLMGFGGLLWDGFVTGMLLGYTVRFEILDSLRRSDKKNDW